MSLGYSRSQNLTNGNINQTLPSISFSKAQDYPFRSDISSGEDQKWYELFGYNYNGQYVNQRNKVGGAVTSKSGILHTINGGLSPKLGHISISPNFNYQEKWYDKSIEIIDHGLDSSGNDSLETKDVKGLNFIRTFYCH